VSQTELITTLQFFSPHYTPSIVLSRIVLLILNTQAVSLSTLPFLQRIETSSLCPQLWSPQPLWRQLKRWVS